MSTKRKASARFAAPTTKSSIKVPTKTTIDESRTAVSATDNIQSALKSSQGDAIEISSDEASDSEVDSDEPMNGVEATETTKPTPAKQTPSQANGASQDEPAGENEDDEDEASPSFGELLRGTIDVPALLSQTADNAKGALVKPSSSLAPPSLSSLGTVLAQALRTEDTELLESCLQITNPDSVQQTIERLDSALAGVLLTKLAARFHRRPGRAGSLMAWVKWTLVAHGGALAVQPKVLDRLVSLQKVLNERSRGLPSLLALKGKLDMLDAQMQLRQARQRRRTVDEEEESDEDDEEDAIYVEGEEAGAAAPADGGAYEDEAAIAVTNGFVPDSDVDDDEDDDVEDDDDDEAGDESLDEDDVDHDDIEDSVSDDESDVEAAPPTKVQKTARTFGKRR